MYYSSPVPALVRLSSSRSRRRWRAAAMAVAGGLLLGALSPPSASAALGLKLVEKTTAAVGGSKSLTVSCPLGKKLTGGGAVLSPTTPGAMIDGIVPNGTLTSLTVHASPSHLGVGAFGLRGRAICANPIAGLERVYATSPVSLTSAKSVSATCPTGKSILGVGAQIFGGYGGVALDDVLPLGDLKSAKATGVTTAWPAGGTWSVRAYAICAYPPPGLQRVFKVSPTDSVNSKSATVYCTGGRKALSSGGGLAGAGGRVYLERVAPDDSFYFGEPMLGYTKVSASEDTLNTSNSWYVAAHAMCANP